MVNLLRTRKFDRSRLVALEEAPEEPIYSSVPEIYRPGPRIYSAGRLQGPSAPESGRENRSGAGPMDFRADRSLVRHSLGRFMSLVRYSSCKAQWFGKPATDT